MIVNSFEILIITPHTHIIYNSTIAASSVVISQFRTDHLAYIYTSILLQLCEKKQSPYEAYVVSEEELREEEREVRVEGRKEPERGYTCHIPESKSDAFAHVKREGRKKMEENRPDRTNSSICRPKKKKIAGEDREGDAKPRAKFSLSFKILHDNKFRLEKKLAFLSMASLLKVRSRGFESPASTPPRQLVSVYEYVRSKVAF